MQGTITNSAVTLRDNAQIRAFRNTYQTGVTKKMPLRTVNTVLFCVNCTRGQGIICLDHLPPIAL